MIGGPTIVKFGCNGFPVAVPVGLFPQQVLHKSQSADERLDQLSLLQTLVTFDRIDLALTRFGSGTHLYSDKVSCGRECPGAPAYWCSPHAPRLRAERFPCQAVALHRYSWRSLPACCPWRALFGGNSRETISEIRSLRSNANSARHSKDRRAP